MVPSRNHDFSKESWLRAVTGITKLAAILVTTFGRGIVLTFLHIVRFPVTRCVPYAGLQGGRSALMLRLCETHLKNKLNLHRRKVLILPLNFYVVRLLRNKFLKGFSGCFVCLRTGCGSS